MIRQGWPFWGLKLLFAALLVGCDKGPDVPRITSNPASQPAAPPPSAPTTQELMSGTYKRISLAPLPLAAQVPQSWETAVPEGTHMTVLDGPAPGGSTARVSLEMGPRIRADKLDRILDGAKKEADKEKLTTILCDVRTVGDMKVLEEQKRFHAATAPQETLIEWKVTYFLRRDDDFSPYTLNIIGLNEPQFEQSKQLLRKIIDSVVYDPAGRTL